MPQDIILALGCFIVAITVCYFVIKELQFQTAMENGFRATYNLPKKTVFKHTVEMLIGTHFTAAVISYAYDNNTTVPEAAQIITGKIKGE